MLITMLISGCLTAAVCFFLSVYREYRLLKVEESEREGMKDMRGLRIDGVFQGHFHKDDPVFNGMWSDEAVRARALKDSNGTVEHKVAKDNGDFCEMLDKPRVAGGEEDRLIEGLLNEIIGEKECERRAADERTRLYREAHCSQCGQPLRKEGQE